MQANHSSISPVSQWVLRSVQQHSTSINITPSDLQDHAKVLGLKSVTTTTTHTYMQAPCTSED